MNNGWIKLHRELFSKPIWLNSTAEQKVILITLLGMVNSAPKEWEWKGEKYVCEAGQCITSLASIAQKCGDGISIKNIRSALVRFEKLEFLANESTKQGRLITILNWSNYQGDDYKGGKGTGKEVAKDWQRGGKEVATNKNNKNNKKDKNSIIPPKSPLDEIVSELPIDLQESVKEFIEHRKQIKAPLTEIALKKMLNQLNKLSGGDSEKCKAILDQSIINGWKGIFELGERRKKKKNEVYEMLERGVFKDEQDTSGSINGSAP